MKNFIQWCEENKLDLPVVTDVESGEETKKENRVRTGYSANYPDAYVKSQYPHKYFNPVKATADLDDEIMSKKQVPLKVKGGSAE